MFQCSSLDPEGFPKNIICIYCEIDHSFFCSITASCIPLFFLFIYGLRTKSNDLGKKGQSDTSKALEIVMHAEQLRQSEEELKHLLIYGYGQAGLWEQLLLERSKIRQAKEREAMAQKHMVEASLEPDVTKAKVLAAISTNLPDEDDAIAQEFDRRVKIAELMLKEKQVDLKAKDMADNKDIVRMQMQQKA